MDDTEAEEAQKKLHELRKHIPFLEAHMKSVPESTNEAHKRRYEKFVQLHGLLTSGKSCKLELLLKIEVTIKWMRGEIEKKKLETTGASGTKQIKQEKVSEAKSIKMEKDFQSPESPPMYEEPKNSDEPITIPTERKEGKNYCYDTKYRRSGSSDGRRYGNDRDYKDSRDDGYYVKRYSTSSNRNRSHSTHRHRDRRSRSKDRKYDHGHSSSSSSYTAKDDRRYSKERDYDRDYRKYDNKNKSMYKTEKYDFDSADRRDVRNNNRSAFSHSSVADAKRQQAGAINRVSVFTRLDPKVPDLSTEIKNIKLESYQADLEELEKTNEERFGISSDSQDLAEQVKKLDSIKEMEESMRKKLMESTEDKIFNELHSKNKIVPKSEKVCTSATNTNNNSCNVEKMMENQIDCEINREPLRSTGAHDASAKTIQSSLPSSSSTLAPNSILVSGRIAYTSKYNRKPRTRIESNDSSSDCSTPRQDNLSPNSNYLNQQQDPRLRNRDPRVSGDGNSIFSSPPSSNLSETFNSFGTVSSLPLPSIVPPPTLISPSTMPIISNFNRNINININPLQNRPNFHTTALRNPLVNAMYSEHPPPQNCFNMFSEHQPAQPPPAPCFNTDDAPFGYITTPPPQLAQSQNNLFESQFHPQHARKANCTYGEHKRQKAQCVSSTTISAASTPIPTKTPTTTSTALINTATHTGSTTKTATSTTTKSATAKTSSTEKSAEITQKKDSNKDQSSKITSNTPKKTHFDKAFRNNNWDALSTKSAPTKAQFKIPKLNKTAEPSTVNDADKPEEKPSESETIKVSTVSKSKETSTLKSSVGSEQSQKQLLGADKVPSAETEINSESKKTKNRRKSVARDKPTESDELTSSSSKDIEKQIEYEAISPESDFSESVVDAEPQPSVNDQPDKEMSNPDLKKCVEDILLNMFKPNNQDQFLSLLEKVLDKDKFTQVKDIITSEKPDACDDTAVTSSTQSQASDEIEKVICGKLASNSASASATAPALEAPSTSDATKTAKKPKKKSNELSRLNEDIRTMFISEGVLTANGRRMCTLWRKEETETTSPIKKTRSKLKVASKTPTITVDDESSSDIELTPPARVLRRRNTTADPEPVISESDNLTESTDSSTPLSKRITRRRDTVFEVIDTPDTNGDTQPPIKIKIFRSSIDSQTNANKDHKDNNSEDEQMFGTKKRPGPKLKNKGSKKAKVDATVQRPNLARECKIILEKVDSVAFERITRAKKRISETTESAGGSETSTNESEIAKDTCNAVSDALPKAKRSKILIKNTDKTMTIKSAKQCVFCDFKNTRHLANHYANSHRDQEVYNSRMSDKFANQLRRNPPQTAKIKINESKLAAFCYYCENYLNLGRAYWITHLTQHTGEYQRQCNDCGNKLVNFKKANQTCSHPNTKIINKIDFEDSLNIFMCNLCNFSQIQEKNVVKHMRDMHDITENVSENYRNIDLISNFYKNKPGRKSGINESDENTVTSEEPVNPDVFKSSKQDDGLFDDDTMKLMKENTFNDSDSMQASCTSIIDRLSERFKQQDAIKMPKEEEEKIDIVYKGPDDDPNPQPSTENAVIDSMPPAKLSDATVTDISTDNRADNGSEIETKETEIADQAISMKQDDIDDVSDPDDTNWESCSTESENDDNSATSKTAESVNKNNLITNTLTRLYSAIGKPKANRFRSLKAKKRSEKSRLTSIACKKEKHEVNPSISESPTKKINTVKSTTPEDLTECEPNEPATAKIIKRIDNIGFSECLGQLEYLCFIGNCNYGSTNSLMYLLDHLRQHKEPWNGFCYSCDKQLLNGAFSLTREYKHMQEIHLQQPNSDISANNETSVQEESSSSSALAPLSQSQSQSLQAQAQPAKILIKCRRFSGDKLSYIKDLHPNAAPALQQSIVITSVATLSIPPPVPTTSLLNTSDLSAILSVSNTDNVLKPWTKCENRKSQIAIQKLSRDVSLVALFKCMAIDCIFSTGDANAMIDHLTNHEDFLTQQAGNSRFQTNLDTSSWLECCYCEEIEDSCKLLVTHIESEHKTSIFQCPYCFYRSADPNNVDYHLSRYHSHKDKLILVCGPNRKHLEDDIGDILLAQEKNVVQIECAEIGCKKTLTHLFDWNNHICFEHKESVYFTCFICHAQVRKDLHAKHMYEHNIRLFHCAYCTFGCSNLDTIRSHISNIHSTKLSYSLIRIKLQTENTFNQASIIYLHEESNEDLLCNPSLTEKQLNFMKSSLSEYSHNAGDMPKDDGPSLQFQNNGEDGADSTQELELKQFKTQSIEKKHNIKLFNELLPTPPPAESLSKNVIETSSTTATTTVSQLNSKLSLRPVQPITSGISTMTFPSTSRAATNFRSTSTNPLVIASIFSGADTVNTTQSSIQTEVDLAAKSIVSGSGFEGLDLYRCGIVECSFASDDEKVFQVHLSQHQATSSAFRCYHCGEEYDRPVDLKNHVKSHGIHRFFCYCCNTTGPSQTFMNEHFKDTHKDTETKSFALNPNCLDSFKDMFVICPRNVVSIKDFGIKLVDRNNKKMLSTKKYYLPEEVNMLPQQSIYTEPVACQLCSYSSKVKTNIYRHLMKADCAVRTATATEMDPVNPVPCLDTGEKYFDKMKNLAASSNLSESSNPSNQKMQFIPEERRYVCGAKSCHYQTQTSDMLRQHINTLHESDRYYNCPHCNTDLCGGKNINATEILNHIRFHDTKLSKCPACEYYHYLKSTVDKHVADMHPRCKDRTLQIARRAKQTDVGKQNKSIVYKWRCNICPKAMFDTRALVKHHLSTTHRLSSQYQCLMCSFQNDTKNTVKEHILSAHSASDVGKIKTNYERVEGDIDVTPIWRRHDPNRVKHIRGILVEEEEASISNASEASVDCNETLLNRKSQSIHLDIKPLKLLPKLQTVQNSKIADIHKASSTSIKIQKITNTDDAKTFRIVTAGSNLLNVSNHKIQNKFDCVARNNRPEQQPQAGSVNNTIDSSSTAPATSTTTTAEAMSTNSNDHFMVVQKQNVEENYRARPPSLRQMPKRRFSTFVSSSAEASTLTAAMQPPISLTVKRVRPTPTITDVATVDKAKDFELMPPPPPTTKLPISNVKQAETTLESLNLIYLCHYCENSAATFDAIQSHWLEKHKKISLSDFASNNTTAKRFCYKITTKVRCIYCTDPVTFHSIRNHVEKMHLCKPYAFALHSNTDTDQLQCGICSLDVENSNEMQKHFRLKHPNNAQSDMKIEPMTVLNNSILDQLLQQGDSGTFKCLHCSNYFPCRYDLEQHHEEKHASNQPSYVINGKDVIKYGCNICREIFTDENRAIQHIRSHLTQQFQCNFCPKKVQYLKLIKTHHELLHNSNELGYRIVNARENIQSYYQMTLTFSNGLMLIWGDLLNTKYGNVDRLVNCVNRLNESIREQQILNLSDGNKATTASATSSGKEISKRRKTLL